MKVLLDTHVLLWWLRDRDQIGPKARALIVSPHDQIVVSVVSFWEIAIKYRRGKLDVQSADAARFAESEGFPCLAVDPKHVAMLETLRVIDGHRDPFDHMLLAQAAVEQAALMTGDRILTRYGIPCISMA